MNKQQIGSTLSVSVPILDVDYYAEYLFNKWSGVHLLQIKMSQPLQKWPIDGDQ